MSPRTSTAIYSVNGLVMLMATTLRSKLFPRSTAVPSRYTATSQVSSQLRLCHLYMYIFCDIHTNINSFIKYFQIPSIYLTRNSRRRVIPRCVYPISADHTTMLFWIPTTPPLAWAWAWLDTSPRSKPKRLCVSASSWRSNRYVIETTLLSTIHLPTLFNCRPCLKIN